VDYPDVFMVLVEMKWNIPAVITLMGLVFLAANFLYAPWRLDPVYDFFMLRSDGMIFAYNHVSCEFAVLGTAIWFVSKDVPKAFQSTMIVFSSFTTHEWITYFISPDAAAGANIQSWLWASGILALGVYFAKRKQRITMLSFGCVFLVYDLCVALYFSATGAAFSDSSLFVNVLEVFGWFLPMSVWWVNHAQQ